MNYFGKPEHSDLSRVPKTEKKTDTRQPGILTYLEYIESMSSGEIKKMKNQSPITQEDINSVDLDELSQQLQK